MESLIHDSLTPYLETYGVQQLSDSGKGGQCGGRLTKSLKKDRKGEVLVLFVGKGAGKSTFIKRLLHHNPPPWLREHSIVAIIDLLNVPEDISVVRSNILTTLIQALDTDNIIGSDRDSLIEQLFKDRFVIAARQVLAGLSKTSEVYNTKLNDLVSRWKNDIKYCAIQMVRYWRKRGRGIIVVVDNTDQFSGINQEFCFTSAQ